MLRCGLYSWEEVSARPKATSCDKGHQGLLRLRPWARRVRHILGSWSVARLGPIDLRTQAEIHSALRTDTPTHPVVEIVRQGRATPAGGQVGADGAEIAAGQFVAVGRTA